MRRLLTLFATAALLGGLMVAPVSAETITTGTWAQYPTGATEYFAEVQQPINSANTSNWSAKSKGGIPIMYKLFSGIGPAVFESIYQTQSTDDDFAFLSFDPDPEIDFEHLLWLSTDYVFSLGDCHGGSLRWSVRIDADDDGLRDPYNDGKNGTIDPSDDVPATGDPAMFIYYGELPNFTDCTSDNQSDTNMIGQPDLRYDTSQFNWHADFGSVQGTGTFYDSYAHALALFEGRRVINTTLVIDSGWGGDQRLTISDTTVNDNVHQWDSGGTGTLAPTCDLPDAFIDVTKLAPVADGIVNETTVYPQSSTDTSKQFRVVDCKYQYVLSIPSLTGTGSYDVEILIDGSSVATSASSTPPSEVRFDLK
jgi:hypothetical protein